MANDSKRVSQLGVTTTLANTDRVVVLTNPGAASANLQTITVNNFVTSLSSKVVLYSSSNTISISNVTFSDNTSQNTAFLKVSAPANSTSNGILGNIAWDTNYLYICTSTNTWKRVALNLTSW